MHGLKFDGAILKAWWKAKLEKPKTWEEFVQIEEIWELADETKRELWELINK